MKLLNLHSWDITTAEARKLQIELATKVSAINAIPEKVEYLAGLDISPPDADGVVTGAAVVLEFPSLMIAETRVAHGKPGLPYIPGLLSFRETPVLTDALEQLELRPDIIYTDGQGIAHPRRFGLACHIGLLTSTPTIGCAKSILLGKHGDLQPQVGAEASMVHHGEEVGAAVRTRTGVKPMYISIGHIVDLPTCVRWVLACCNGRRMPEATRIAHNAAAGKVPLGRPSPKSQ